MQISWQSSTCIRSSCSLSPPGGEVPGGSQQGRGGGHLQEEHQRGDEEPPGQVQRSPVLPR